MSSSDTATDGLGDAADGIIAKSEQDFSKRVSEPGWIGRYHYERLWREDGKIRTDEVASLRGHVELAGKPCRYGGVKGDHNTSGMSEDDEKKDFVILLSYMDKGVKAYADSNARKEAHIRLMIQYCMTLDWKFAVEKCKEYLGRLCTEGGAWRTYMPRALQANISKYGAHNVGENGVDPVVLCADVLKQAGLDASHLYKEYWQHKSVICAEFVTYLLKKNRRHARRVASVGLDLFPDNDVLAAAALCAFDPKSPDMVKARCVAYACNPDTTHYYEMARDSEHWNKQWARRLACMLAAREEFDAESRVLNDAGLVEEMLAALEHDGTAESIYENKNMAERHPEKYYEICRRFVEDSVAEAYEYDDDDNDNADDYYDDIKTCLQIARDIPRVQKEFKNLSSMLLRDHSDDAKLVSVIKGVMNGA